MLRSGIGDSCITPVGVEQLGNRKEVLLSLRGKTKSTEILSNAGVLLCITPAQDSPNKAAVSSLLNLFPQQPKVERQCPPDPFFSKSPSYSTSPSLSPENTIFATNCGQKRQLNSSNPLANSYSTPPSRRLRRKKA